MAARQSAAGHCAAPPHGTCGRAGHGAGLLQDLPERPGKDRKGKSCGTAGIRRSYCCREAARLRQIRALAAIGAAVIGGG